MSEASELAVIDIGGTHVRFAIARVANGTVESLGEPTTFHTADFASLAQAWAAFGEARGGPLPDAAAIAFAGPVRGEVLKLTNSSWLIRPAHLDATLGVGKSILINDFAAVGHAVAHLGPEHFRRVCGPDDPLPDRGTISIIGPGTGLGVAHVLRHDQGYRVNETEGGHMDFAALDDVEDRFVGAMRAKFGRVSAERIASGPGLRNLYGVVAAGSKSRRVHDDDTLWAAALEGSDRLAELALERFCLSLGAIAGDVALAQGGSGVVIAGGIGLRLAERLAASGFPLRFVAKGRFQAYMSGIPVKVLIHPEPGLWGAAAAYAVEHTA